MREIVLDTETTGLNRRGDVSKGHRVIEIGCVEIDNGVVTGREFHSYLNPGRKIDKKAVAIHGIKDGDVKNKPVFGDVVDEFLSFIGDGVLIIHNAPFDIAFLNQEFSLLSPQKRPYGRIFRFIDTLPLTRKLFPGCDNRLDALISRLGIDTERIMHGALLDAQCLSKVWVLLRRGRFDKFLANS